MRLSRYAIAVALLTLRASAVPEEDDDENENLKPCSIRSPRTGSYFDLTPIQIKPTEFSDKPSGDQKTASSWAARGYDYGANFTMNFCGPVVETLGDVVGVDQSLAANVSAYYKQDGRTYSIGHNNDTLVFRGKKMVLTYYNGSPCDPDWQEGEEPKRRKSTLISLLCDRDPTAIGKVSAEAAFIGASPDECTYFFEVRTRAACPAANVEQSQIGPSGVFSVIAIIAILVYLIGGIVYQRAVMNQRGWRQLPNYSLWAGIWTFVVDFVVIIFSSCRRCLPRRRGYSRVSASGRVGGLLSPSDDDNRLLDQLDEDWED